MPMDPAASASATNKMLDTLRSMPAWLLIGLSLSLGAVWFWPSLLVSLPEAIQSTLPAVLLAVAILTACKVASSGLEQMIERRRHSHSRDRERLFNLYRPLDSLFLTRHVTVSIGIGSPRLRDRLKNAWEEARAYRRRWTCMKRAWIALFDRQISLSAEIDGEGTFRYPRLSISSARNLGMPTRSCWTLLVRPTDRAMRNSIALS